MDHLNLPCIFICLIVPFTAALLIARFFLYVYGQFLEHIDVPKRIKAVTQEYTVVGEGHTGMKQSKGRQVLLVVVAVGAVRATMLMPPASTQHCICISI